MLSHLQIAIIGLTALCCSGNQVIVLDDKGAKTNQYAYEGSYAPCLEDAYQGQFVHDWGDNKGQASATFSFFPPQDGCYLVEEYHPGGDQACSRYLLKNAKLEVGWCKGRTQQLTIDQSRNGGKWTAVGKWPFYKGTRGTFTLSNSAGDSCNAERCFWVADAFRVTRIGNTCNGGVGAAEQEQSSSGPVVLQERDPPTEEKQQESLIEESPQEAKEESPQEAKEESSEAIPNEANSIQAGVEARGTVSLIVTSSDDDVNLKLQLEKHGVLEAGLKTYFGYESVDLVSINIAKQRRLAEMPASKRRIDAVFEGKGTAGPINDVHTLAYRFQVLFDAKDTGIQVKSASVSWETSSTEQPVDSPTPVLQWVALGSGLLVGASILVMTALYVRKIMKKNAAAEAECTNAENPKVIEEGKVIEDPEKPKEESKDEDTVSVSTAPPPSDADICSETGSATPTIAVPKESVSAEDISVSI